MSDEVAATVAGDGAPESETGAREFAVAPAHEPTMLGASAKTRWYQRGEYVESMKRHPMAREFSVIIEQDAEGYFVASVPALRGCHTQAKSLDELMARMREAVELCLEVQGDAVEPLDFIGVQRITVA